MSERTKVLSTHLFRRVARRKERKLTAQLRNQELQAPHELADPDLPSWVGGFRVEKAGRFQWAVVATSHRGH